MDTVPVNLFIPIGAIVAALVAGLFSFFNLVLSKEQKLSELRQDWIDGLRNDLAEHIAAIQAIGYLHGIYHHTPEGQVNYVDLSKATHEPHVKAVTSRTRILLRLNPDDRNKTQVALIGELNKMSAHFNETRYDDAANCIPDVRKNAQLVLKAEWERVKQGEPTFRWSKRITLLVLIASLTLGGLLAFQTLAPSSAHSGPENEASSADEGSQSTH